MNKEEKNEKTIDENEGLFSEDDQLEIDSHNESVIMYDIIKEITKECIFPLFDLLCAEDITEFLKE